MSDFFEHFINIGTMQICLCEWGQKNDLPSIVILHGWLDHAGTWDAVAQNLVQNGFHCIAIDHRGHGKSSHSAAQNAYHFPDYVSDLQSILQILQINHFVLLGHSMGGTIASIYAAFCEPRPRQLILIDGLGPEHESEEAALNRFQTHLTQRRYPHQHKVMTKEVAISKYQRVHPYLPTESILPLLNRILKEVDTEEWIWTWDPRHRHRSAVGFHLPRHLKILQKISIPCVLIFGDQGWYMQMMDLPQRIKAITEKKTIRLASGHNPHLECPTLLAHSIMEHLSTQHHFLE